MSQQLNLHFVSILMDSFQAKCFDGVPFVDPFLQFAG